VGAAASDRDAVHHRIVSAIGRAVADRLLPGDAEARVKAATSSDRAIEAYRRGLAANGDRLAQLSEAIEAFSMAVRIDPGFAPAWAALARVRASRAMLDGRDASEFRLAREEAQRARAADDSLAAAHLALGQVSFSLDADTRGAEIAMRRAKALGAAAGDQLWLAWVLNADGRDAEALRVIDEALTHEPRNALLHAWRGLLLHALRRYDEEIVELRHAVALDDRSWEAVLHLGLGYSRRMQYDLALPALRRAVALSDTGALALAWLGRVSADAGDVASAERIVARLRALAPARGLSPSLGASVCHHIDAHRRTTIRPSS
jgi:tetratricopeptide (TPR) repeat protein